MPKRDLLNDFLDPHRIVGEQHSTYDTSSDVVSPTNLEFLVETICLTAEVHDLMHAAVYGNIKSIVAACPENEEEEEEEEEEMPTKSQLKKKKSEMRKSSTAVGEEANTLLDVYSQEKAKNTSFQEEHDDNKEIASKSAEAVLSNDVRELQRTQCLSPNAEFDQKSKSVLETLPEGEDWTKPPWANQKARIFQLMFRGEFMGQWHTLTVKVVFCYICLLTVVPITSKNLNLQSVSSTSSIEKTAICARQS
jgi:hypothetical protein